jgi:AraC-like DNA-binding protein
VERYVPGRLLRDRVVSIDRVSSQGHTSQVLPSAGAVLGLQLSGRILGPAGPLSSFGVTGIPDSARRYTYDGPTETFLVRFQPQGAACLGVPADLLRGQSLSLDELWDGSGRERAARLVAELLATSDAARRVTLLEEFLLSLPFRRDMRLERALQLLACADARGEGARVAAVARELSLSERQLERLFLQRVGIPPKRYARLRRFERALRLVRLTGEVRDLGEVACASGYTDQAHFNRDFRSFTGTTPRRYLQANDFVG